MPREVRESFIENQVLELRVGRMGLGQVEKLHSTWTVAQRGKTMETLKQTRVVKAQSTEILAPTVVRTPVTSSPSSGCGQPWSGLYSRGVV